MRVIIGVTLGLVVMFSVAAYPQAAAESTLVTGATGAANARGASSLKDTITNATKKVSGQVSSATAGAQAASPTTKPVAAVQPSARPVDPKATPSADNTAPKRTGIAGATSVAPAKTASATKKNGLTIITGEASRISTETH